MTKGANPKEANERSNHTIRQLELRDLTDIKQLLEEWLINAETNVIAADEINEILGHMQNSISGNNDRIYFIAEHQLGTIKGVSGIRKPKTDIYYFSQTERPVELVNMYIASDSRGQGIGTMLLHAIVTYTRSQNYTELLTKSSPRYKNTAWGFYDRSNFTRVGTTHTAVDGGGNAQVWRLEL